MSHTHAVIDTDVHYKIDGVTRTIININETKRMLVQGDHRSERLTFEVPRYVDGHDISKCNFTQVHFRNEDKFQKNVSASFYDVDDLHIKGDSEEDSKIVILSWLVEREATVYEGTLDFSILFKCIINGVVDYSWNTTTFKGIDIKPAICNDKKIIQEYPDVIASITPHVGKNGNWWVGDNDTGVMAECAGGGIDKADWIARKGLTVDFVLFEQTINFTGNRVDFDSSLTFYIQSSIDYSVLWDGVLYECEARNCNYYPYLGNGRLVFGDAVEDTGEPFCFTTVDDYSDIASRVTKSTADAEKIAFKVGWGTREDYIKMPPEYLPDGVVKSVNGNPPDKNGNVMVEGGSGGDVTREEFDALYDMKADKVFVINIFEQLKVLIETGKTDEAIAVLDEAILDMSTLA